MVLKRKVFWIVDLCLRWNSVIVFHFETRLSNLLLHILSSIYTTLFTFFSFHCASLHCFILSGPLPRLSLSFTITPLSFVLSFSFANLPSFDSFKESLLVQLLLHHFLDTLPPYCIDRSLCMQITLELTPMSDQAPCCMLQRLMHYLSWPLSSIPSVWQRLCAILLTAEPSHGVQRTCEIEVASVHA